MSAWVYILECSDSSFYTGCTTDLDGRMNKHHNTMEITYTSTRRPFRLVFAQEFYTVEEAIRSERQIKGWSRAKKKALIDSNFELLVELSKNSKVKSKYLS